MCSQISFNFLSPGITYASGSDSSTSSHLMVSSPHTYTHPPTLKLLNSSSDRRCQSSEALRALKVCQTKRAHTHTQVHCWKQTQSSIRHSDHRCVDTQEYTSDSLRVLVSDLRSWCRCFQALEVGQAVIVTKEQEFPASVSQRFCCLKKTFRGSTDFSSIFKCV